MMNYQVLYIHFHSKSFLIRNYLDILPNWVPNTENDVQEFLLNFLDYIMAGIRTLVIIGLNASAKNCIVLYYCRRGCPPDLETLINIEFQNSSK